MLRQGSVRPFSVVSQRSRRGYPLTLKISAGYDPALTPALETRTVSKYEGKFIYSYLRNLLRMKVSSLTFGRQCDYHTNPGRLQIRHALRAKHLRSRVFFFPMRLVRPSQDGERTVPLANMLFGAKNANTHSICGGSIAAFTKRRHDP